MTLVRAVISFFFCVCLLVSCSAKVPSASLPGGYKIWVMNAQEIYLSDKDDELLVGPGLRAVGVTARHIVAFCEPASEGYQGNLRSSGYSLVLVESGVIHTGLQLRDVERELASTGDEMPKMLSYDEYPTAPN